MGRSQVMRFARGGQKPVSFGISSENKSSYGTLFVPENRRRAATAEFWTENTNRCLLQSPMVPGSQDAGWAGCTTLGSIRSCPQAPSIDLYNERRLTTSKMSEEENLGYT